MAALIAYAAGLTTTGLEILSQALTEVFGEVSIQELGKDNLRYSVRMSMKSSSVVLVVLDSSSSEACKDIENGLYSSDKYVSYTDDKGLTSFLNEKYGLSLDMPVDVEDIKVSDEPKFGSVSSQDVSELRESYEARIADKDALIRNLQATVRELERVISNGGYVEDTGEVDTLRNENVLLRSQLSDLRTQLDALQSQGIHSDEEFNELVERLSDTERRLDNLKVEFSKVSQECTEAQKDGSRKSGVLRDKEAEIERLTKQIEGLTVFVGQHQDCDSKIASLKSKIADLEGQVRGLTGELTARKAEIARLNAELSSNGKTQEQIEEYKRLLEEERERADFAEKNVEAVKQALATLQKAYEKACNDRDDNAEDLKDVRAKLAKSDEYVTELNIRNVELSSRVRVLEQSTSRDASMEETLSEMSALKKKLSILEGNIFNVLYAKAMPKSPTRAIMFSSLGIAYKNIRFVFSGSTESRKGTYKCLLNEIKRDTSGNKYLLVDVVSETFVDYVFEIRKTVNGLKWFTDGGGVQQYITQTVVSNARVLSPGLGYINDSFYLTVNWERRLQELEESGYKVIVYCGDLSNVVGRVLFENFADMGTTDVYVHGNSVGSRTILGVSRGISNIKKATVKYFEYDPQVSMFVDHMRQKCACEVVSSIGR